METQSNPEDVQESQKIFTNQLISSQRKSYTSLAQSFYGSNLPGLLEQILTHILSEQLIDIKSLNVDKCEVELFCSKLSIQQIKDLILTQDSSKLSHIQLQHYQNYQKDIDLIKQSIDPRKLKMIVLQCSKLVTSFKTLQLLINKFKVQIYATSTDGELNRLQCYHILEKVQAELQQLTKHADLVKDKLAERNELQQFLNYPIKDVYKQEIRKQFCTLFLKKGAQQQKIEVFLQPTLTVNKKLTSSRQITQTLFRPAKHLVSLSNDVHGENNTIKSKITQHFSSVDKSSNDTTHQNSHLNKFKIRFNQSICDSLTIKLLEALYLLLQTNFMINNIEDILEQNNGSINISQLQLVNKQLKTTVCCNIFHQVISSYRFKLNEEVLGKEMKNKCKQDLKLISEFFTQEQLALLNSQILHFNTTINQYLNQLTVIIYQLLETNKNNINLDPLRFSLDKQMMTEKLVSLVYGQSLLMIKHLQCNNPILLYPLSVYLSKTTFSEQQYLLPPFQQQVNSLNKQINQVMLQAENESISNLLFETYVCIVTKHVIDRRESCYEQLNVQAKMSLKQISQIVQGQLLKQQLLSYSEQKVQLFELNEVASTIEWLFDQHILKKHINRALDSLDEFTFFIQQIISQCKALFDEDFFNDNIKFNRISSQLQLFENYVRQEILKKPSEQQLKILWTNKIFRLFHKLNNEYLPSSRATTRRKQITEPRQIDSQTAFQSPSQKLAKPIFLRQSIFVKGNKTFVQHTERLAQSTLKVKESKEIEKKNV